MKKVCHLSSVHHRADTRIFYKECTTLVDAGYDVTLVVQNDKDEVVDGIKIIGIDKPKNRRERLTRTTHQVYRRALECSTTTICSVIFNFLFCINHSKQILYMALCVVSNFSHATGRKVYIVKFKRK